MASTAFVRLLQCHQFLRRMRNCFGRMGGRMLLALLSPLLPLLLKRWRRWFIFQVLFDKLRRARARQARKKLAQFSTTPVPDPFKRISVGESFEQYYELLNNITDSTFGRVFECRGRQDSSKGNVVKIVRMKDHPLLNGRGERGANGWRGGRAETDEFWSYMNNLLELKHEHIVRYLEFFADSSAFYFVMERCPGQTLLGHLLSETSWREAAARPLIEQLLQALKYIHNLELVHRDIKLENLMVRRLPPVADCGHRFLSPSFRQGANVLNVHLKLLDFGLGCKATSASGTIGTIGYMAPEVFGSRPYGCNADIFSTGAVMHMLLTGQPCFKPPKNLRALEEHLRVLHEGPDWSWKSLQMVTKNGLDLLDWLLTPTSDSRCSASEALRHNWLRQPLADGPVLWKSSCSELQFLKVMGVWSNSASTSNLSNAVGGKLQSIEESEGDTEGGAEEGVLENLFSKLVRTMTVPVCVADPSKPDCPVVAISRGFKELTGFADKDIVGKNCRVLQKMRAHEIPSDVREKLRKASRCEDKFLGVLPNVKADGSFFDNLLHLSHIDVCGHPILVAIQMEVESCDGDLAGHEILGVSKKVLTAIRHWVRPTR
eukprot:TRINITY_DN70901_c0_g1_i1.p1 TRINITY_DN70901_c0_g1~~TRINITY_DN70901_c0_g1_i1.p1  ORF type:complete len:602 (+),score=81.64 TRINITY_DN70901_c0_g1_i1:74-1879(+)